MDSLTTTSLLPHNPYLFKSKLSHSIPVLQLLHFQYRRDSRLVISKAIRSPNFDFNPPSFDDYGYSDEDSQVRRRRRIRSKRKSNNRRRKQRRWWSDELEEDTEPQPQPQSGMFEQVVDSLWILQVFKSYGWFLPIILISFLAATGPKAFLMAISIPFGLSLLIFAFERFSGWLEGSSKPRKKRRRGSNFGRRKDEFMEEEDDREEVNPQDKRNRKRDYQSWVARNNGASYKKDPSSRVSVNSFGGWDELVIEDETQHVSRPLRD